MNRTNERRVAPARNAPGRSERGILLLSGALALLIGSSEQNARAQPGAAQSLPPVVVEQPQAKRRQAAPSPAHRTRTQRAARSRNAAPPPTANTVAPSPAGRGETATGPVQGYIANQSATATKTDTPLRETPQSISVVTADRVKDQGAMTVQETLRYVPGVFADAYGPDSRGDFPRFRGSDPNIYLDGTRLIDTFQFNQLRPDPYALERIEVLRGPSSVLYGDTSTAGLLNLVSKRPQAETHREIGIQYGSFDRKQIQTDMTGKLSEDGQWLYRFIGIFRDSNYQTDFVKNDRIVIAPSVTWRPTTATNWTLLGTYQKDTSGSSTAFLPIEGTLYPGPNGRIPVNRFVGAPGFDTYQTTSGSVSSLFEHAFNDAFTLRQNTRYTHTNGIYNTMYPEQYFNDGTNPNYPFLDATRRTVARIVSARDTTKDALTSDTNAELKLQTGPVSHRLLAGFDYRRLDDRARSGAYVDTTPFDLYAPVYAGVAAPTLSAEPDSLQSQSGLYLQDQLRLGPWIAVLGVRQDWVTSDVQGAPVQNDKATTWRAGLMYELPFGMTPYVSYAQSFNPIFGSGVCATLCQPMRGEQVEAGFKYQPFKGLVVNAALYDVSEKNRLAADPANPLYSIQTGEVRIQGAELEVLASATRDLDIIGAYAYTDARVQSGDNAGNHVETVPLHQASLWAKYRLDGLGLRGFTIGAGARYIGETWDGAEHFKTPDYTLFDAMLRYETGPWRWQINASNLADKQHVTTCLARGDCFYGAGRTILTSLTYKF